MAYTTHSNSSPENNTSYINTSNVSLVPNNPYNPNATTINWPTSYDLFVNKTNDQQVSVSVSDETHAVSEITADSGLYLNHKPRRGTTITATDGIIDASLTDYNHGIIYFSTLPTVEVTLTYLADPDKYYGEYLTQIQDVLHKIEIWAGAGSSINEGVRTAEVLINSTNTKVDSKLPHNIHIADLGKDITFQSDAANTVGNTINLGNSYDLVTVNAKEFNVFRGTFNDGNTGDPVVATITDHSGDTVNMRGLVNLSPTGITRATGITFAAITGALFTTQSGRDGGANDALRVFGDTFIAGDLFTMGNHVVQNVTTTSSFNVFTDNMLVKGDSFLGDATTDNVYIAGPTTATGKITAKDNLEITKSISFTNNDSTTVSTVDGLDASYIANRHTYMRPAGPDWCGDSINICSFGVTAGTGNVNGGYEGSTTHPAVVGKNLIDTSAATAYALTGVSYYTGRFNDGNWIADIRSGPDVGQKVPIVKWDPAITGWELSRSLSTLQDSGVSYRVCNPHYNLPDFVSVAGTTFTISATATSPVVADVRGIVKVCNSNTPVSMQSVTGRHYLFMSNENADAGGLNSLESNPIWYTETHGVPSDKSIVVGHVDVTGATPVVDDTSLVTYQQSNKYDSTWLRLTDLTSNNYLEHPQGADTDHNIFYHNLGGEYRIHDVKFTIFGAPDDAAGTAPDLSDIEIFTPNDTVTNNLHISGFNDRSFEIRLGSGAPLNQVQWFRLIAEIR